MKFFKNLSNKLFRSRKSVAVAVSVASLAVLSGVVFAGWTPGRTTFDWNNPEQRKGSLNGPVFNSFINTPYYGDERAFFDASRTDQADQPNAFKDVLSNPTQGSKEVILRTYIHNNANQSTNASGVGVAQNTKVRIDLPTGTEKALRMRSYINWSNPAPGYQGEVTDTTELVDSKAFSISYVPGSAKIYNAAHNAASGGVTLPDSIVSSGASVGYDVMNGLFPGCFDYQAMVEIRVKVTVPEIEIQKEVREAGVTKWGELAEVKPGEKIQWLIGVENKGTRDLTDVQVSDQLPPHVSLVPGSVRYIDAAQDVVQQDKPLFTTGGINTGTWKPNGGFYIRFDTLAKDDFEACEVTVRNLGFTKSKETPTEIQDHADVKITKENCNPTTPVYTCDALEVTKLGGKKYSYTVRYTAKDGATFKNAKFTFGDNTTPLITDKTTVEHTYATGGSYASKVDVTFSVDGRDRTVTSEACAKIIEISNPIYTCDLLTAKSLGNRSFSYTVRYTAKDGATFKNVSYNFGDNTSPLVSDKTTVEHTYAKDGQYTTKATVTFMVDGKEVTATSDNCATTVDAKTPPKYCPIPGKTNLPENSPECVEKKYCPIPGKTNLPVNSPECVIPNTGAGEIIGLFAATTVAGAAAHHVFTSRRFGRQ